jgi:hypothetical protein
MASRWLAPLSPIDVGLQSPLLASLGRLPDPYSVAATQACCWDRLYLNSYSFGEAYG